MGVRVQHHTPAAYPREKTSTHCEGDYMGSRPGLDMCGKIHPHWDSIREPSSP
jgi:hypothetical protein